MPGGELRIAIEDAGSRVNLNALMDVEGEPWPASLEFLETALERIVENMPGRDEDKPYDPRELAVAILDWMDTNQVTESFGDDEQRFYLRNPGSVSSPVDRPLFSIEELAGIPGMDRRLRDALGAYFSTQPMRPLPGTGGINPNTAAPHVLGLICHGLDGEGCRLFSRDDVFSVLRLREDLPFCEVEIESDSCQSFASELDLIGEAVFPPLEYSGDVFAIRIEARYGPTRACLTSTIAEAGVGEPRTLYYRLGC